MLSPHHHYNQHRSPVPHLQSTNPTATSAHNYEPAYTPLYHPTPNQPLSPSKRLKIQHDIDFTDIPSTFDCPPLVYPTAMPHKISRPRSLAPHISVQRASEPASPVTIASTASNNSTPSPSPSRVTIISDGSPHDFPLFEEGFQLSEHQSKQTPRRAFTSNTSNPSPIPTQFNSNFVSSDTAWSNYFPSTQSMDVSPQQQMQQYIQATAPGYDHATLARVLGQPSKHSVDDEELPALSPSRNNNIPSRPSISESDVPVTPVHSPRKRGGNSASIREDASGYVHKWMTNCLHDKTEHSRNVPKLAQTISDAVQDELFNSGIAPGTAHAHHDRQIEANRTSQFPSLFQQAQSQHAMARSSPVNKPQVVRDHSPFRANSPFHPARTQDPVLSPTRAAAFLPVGSYPTARARREMEVEREAEALKAHMKKEYEEMQQDPKTISPKDAYIEYNESEGKIRGSLFSNSQQDDAFSPQSTTTGDVLSSNESYHGSVHDDEDIKAEHNYGSMATSCRESDVTMDYGAPMFPANSSQNYNQQHLGVPHTYGWSNDHPGQGDTSNDDKEYEYDCARSPSSYRPEDTKANSGAYSCTVHGCTQRFPTANKMSKHRREVHRHGTPMNRDTTVRWQHQGPHKCTRINPTTGKPCNTIFSRPYDLTRHEDTIHNTAREKVRCEICNDEKTFSRHDALTRHKKVKHGIDK